MANTGQEEWKIPGVERPLDSGDFRRFRMALVLLLLVGGFLLVVYSSAIGIMLIQNCSLPGFSLPGFCIMSNDTVEAAAMTCRFVGLMIFLAGLAERIAMAIAKPKSD